MMTACSVPLRFLMLSIGKLDLKWGHFSRQKPCQWQSFLNYLQIDTADKSVEKRRFAVKQRHSGYYSDPVSDTSATTAGAGCQHFEK